MLWIVLIWILLAFVLGVIFGKFAKAGMGSQSDEYRAKETGKEDHREDNTCP